MQIYTTCIIYYVSMQIYYFIAQNEREVEGLLHAQYCVQYVGARAQYLLSVA